MGQIPVSLVLSCHRSVFHHDGGDDSQDKKKIVQKHFIAHGARAGNAQIAAIGPVPIDHQQKIEIKLRVILDTIEHGAFRADVE